MRMHSSAGTSPCHCHVWWPPAQTKRAVTTAAGNGTRKSDTTCTSTATVSPGVTNAGGRSATTITGRHASTSAWYPSFGWRSCPSTDHVTAGWPSAKQNCAKPPVGRYFSRRSVSM